MKELETEFYNDVQNIIKECVKINYTPTKLIEMINNRKDVVGVARSLIIRKEPAYGYTKLCLLNKMDLTLEALIVENPKYKDLFTDKEIQICKDRLMGYNYVIKSSNSTEL